MKRLLIVDDERIERDGIKMLLKSMGKELDILEAGNGKQALQILHERDVDLLLTDIKMPFMTGLDLAKQVREMGKDMQIAIFSGFGEFTYAQEAIKYDVTDYILKPVKPKEFKATIERMLERCRLKEEAEDEKRNNTSFLNKYFLQQYIFTGKSEYIEKICRICVGDKKTDLSNIQNIMLLDADGKFFEEHGGDLIELLQKELGRKLEYLDLDMGQMLLFFFKSANDNYPRIAKAIHEIIMNEYGENTYIAVSRNLKNIKEYPKAYQELESQMENKFYYSDKCIFVYEMENEQNTRDEQIADYQKRIKENIKLKDIRHLWENYEKLKNQIKDESMDSQIYIKFIFSEVVKDLYEEIHVLDTSRVKQAVIDIYQARNLNSICEITEKCIQEYEQQSMKTENGMRSDIDQVKQYIAYHVNEDLSIDSLAAKVYLSQSYLSYIFKKETGMNLSRYIKQCRMEKAQELLKNTNMKIVQICEKVGFSNVSYFCQSFREYCGVSPDKYRRGECVDEVLD